MVSRLWVVLLSSLLLGCAKKEVGGVPKWVVNFVPEKGKVCGVGTAGLHMQGPAYQRATAIARAVDEIARQKGVNVSTQLEYFMRGSSEGGASSSISVYSVHTTEGQTIRARIVETYYDTEKQMFYVLMCEEK